MLELMCFSLSRVDGAATAFEQPGPIMFVMCWVQAEGVAGYFGAVDVPGDNRVGAVVHDEDLFADSVVTAVGQAIGIVVADTEAQARAGARYTMPTLHTLS